MINPVADKLLAITFSLLILWQAWVVRRAVGTWLFPACIFGLFWWGYTFVPLVVLPQVPVQPLAVGFILLCMVAFSASAGFFDWHAAFAINKSRARRSVSAYDSGLLRWLFWLLTAVSLACLVANSYLQGFTFQDIVFDFIRSAARYADMRGNEELVSSIYLSLGVVFSYVAVALGGIQFARAQGKLERLWMLTWSLLPSVFVMLTQSEKGQFLLAAVFFYSAVLLYNLDRGNTVLFKPGTLHRAVLGVAVSVALLTVSFMARGLHNVDDTSYVVNRLLGMFASYSCGHLYAFGDWFSHVLDVSSVNIYVDEQASYGFYTFMAMYRLFGIDREVPSGVYQDYFSYGDDFLGTNIFTMFRGLILDFGLLGSVLFMFLSGLVLHRGFHSLLVARRPSFSAALFVFMNGYFYTSFIISVLIWNSFYASFLILAVLLWANYFFIKTRSEGFGLHAPLASSAR